MLLLMMMMIWLQYVEQRRNRQLTQTLPHGLVSVLTLWCILNLRCLLIAAVGGMVRGAGQVLLWLWLHPLLLLLRPSP